MSYGSNLTMGQLISGALRCGPFMLAAVALFFGLGSPAAQRSTVPQTRAGSPAISAPVKAYGSKNAPITVEVFSDYLCPHCREFYEDTLRLVIANYVASGKVYLVHRDFPFINKYSGQAARWASACAEVGQFAPAEMTLYEHQSEWGVDGEIGKFIAAAIPASDFRRVQLLMKDSATPAPEAVIGSSANPLAGVVHPCPVDPYIAQDIELGYQIPVRGTPTIVITSRGHRFSPVSGVISWPILKQFFDALLSKD